MHADEEYKYSYFHLVAYSDLLLIPATTKVERDGTNKRQLSTILPLHWKRDVGGASYVYPGVKASTRL